MVELRFSLVKMKQLRFAHLEGFMFYVSQRRKQALNECSCLLFFWLRYLIDFRFADFRMIRISAFPVFRVSGFPRFQFRCQPTFDLAEPVE